MERMTMKFPFEVAFKDVQTDLDKYVTAVFSCLESEFLVMPKGDGFVEYPMFEKGYEALKQATGGFRSLTPVVVMNCVKDVPVSVIVIRTILGFTPPEWAYVATQHTKMEISQGFVRALDRDIRMAPLTPLTISSMKAERLNALVETACAYLKKNVPKVTRDKIHRLDKADTKTGLDGIKSLADIGAPYAMLLYERFLGRPFAGHRDSVSDLIGDSLESAIEDVLSKAGITYIKTKRAEKVPGFDQSPDFIIPSQFNPQVIIEAKITEDDGTARDKVTRIQHLGQLSMAGKLNGKPKYEVIACIAGRGFGVRREDMKKMLLATRGKVFTLQNLDKLVECTKLKEFRTK
ncbi:MAG: hypothetical protein ACYC7L_11580 [Nitrospirota bacterium]